MSPSSLIIIQNLTWLSIFSVERKKLFFSHPTYAPFLFHFVGFPARSNTDWRVSPHTHTRTQRERKPDFSRAREKLNDFLTKEANAKNNWEKPENGSAYKIGWVFLHCFLSGCMKKLRNFVETLLRITQAKAVKWKAHSRVKRSESGKVNSVS